MDALVEGLLSFVRLDRENLETIDVDLDGLLREVCQDLSVLIDDKAAKVECLDLPIVSGDRVQLTQLFQNLIGNAITFCPERQPLVTICAVPSGPLWTFAVTDNGIGINPGVAPKLFDLFARGQKRDQFDGTGIGLSVARKVVENHGGTIRIDPQYENGTRIIFTLRRTN
jgi:signal transduction histidine kinase